MEPIPQTTEALGEIDDLAYDTDLLEELRGTAARVHDVVPSCIAMSVTMLEHQVTLTLVATGPEAAVLDAAQYLGGGPCIAAVATGDVVPSDAALLDEHDWHLFARASAAHGIHSTLSMPLIDASGAVIGGVNLYSTALHDFDDRHDELASICGAWATGAVENADLSFRSRHEAHQAPEILRDRTRVDAAVGVLAHRLGVPVETARARLDAAATSVGLPLVSLAHALLGLAEQQPTSGRRYTPGSHTPKG